MHLPEIRSKRSLSRSEIASLSRSAQLPRRHRLRLIEADLENLLDNHEPIGRNSELWECLYEAREKIRTAQDLCEDLS